MQVNVVHGAPLSGKSTYVKEHIGENDIVFDFDYLMSSLSGKRVHNHNESIVPYILDIRDLIINKLKGEENIDNAWIIVTKPTEALKKSLIGLNAEYIEMKIDINQARKRLIDNPDGRDIDKWNSLIDRYYGKANDYEGFYLTKKWKMKRKAILKRDEYKCRECSRFGKVEEATTVHHVHPLKIRPELKLDERNLISLCEGCHEKMHNKFNEELSKLGKEWVSRINKKYSELNIPPTLEV